MDQLLHDLKVMGFEGCTAEYFYGQTDIHAPSREVIRDLIGTLQGLGYVVCDEPSQASYRGTWYASTWLYL